MILLSVPVEELTLPLLATSFDVESDAVGLEDRAEAGVARGIFVGATTRHVERLDVWLCVWASMCNKGSCVDVSKENNDVLCGR